MKKYTQLRRLSTNLVKMTDFKQRFEIIYNKYVDQYGAGCAKVNETTFAKFLAIPLTSVRNWRDRNTVPTAKGVKAIHDKLGFSYDWLISGEGEMMDTTAERIAELEGEVAKLKRQAAEGPQARDGMGKAVGQE